MTPAESAYVTSAASSSSEDDLVMQGLSQVYYSAARIRERLPQQVDLEDLVSAGVIGLLGGSAQLRRDQERPVQYLCQVSHPWSNFR